MTIANTSIAHVDGNGIVFGSRNTVGVTNVSITDAGDNGIQFDYRNTVTIAGTTIDLNNVGSDGINFLSRNTVTISNTSISNAGDDGISFDNRNSVTIADTTFSGSIGGYVVAIDGTNNTLSGGDNVSTAAAPLCFAPLTQIGNFTFATPPQTCP